MKTLTQTIKTTTKSLSSPESVKGLLHQKLDHVAPDSTIYTKVATPIGIATSLCTLFYRWLTQLDVVRMVQIAVRIALIITLQFFLACSVIAYSPGSSSCFLGATMTPSSAYFTNFMS